MRLKRKCDSVSGIQMNYIRHKHICNAIFPMTRNCAKHNIFFFVRSFYPRRLNVIRRTHCFRSNRLSNAERINGCFDSASEWRTDKACVNKKIYRALTQAKHSNTKTDQIERENVCMTKRQSEWGKRKKD